MYLPAQMMLFMLRVNLVCPANILVMLPLAFYSHSSSFQPVIKELAARGHNVTVVGPYPQKIPIQNITDVVLPNFAKEFLDTVPKEKLLELGSYKFQLTGLWNLGINGGRKALQHERIQELIQDTGSRFDLVILETWFVHEVFIAFGHKFNAPVVNFMPTFLFPSGAYFTGNHYAPSYVPVVKPGFATDSMSFSERVANVFCLYVDVSFGHLYYLRELETTMREYFRYPGSENLPSLVDMLKNTSLTLINNHLAIGYPVPFHKNVVLYGGVHLEKPGKLPKDLQELMDKSDEGIVYFSFGSFASLSNLKPTMQEAVLSALSKINLKVLMRLEDNELIKTIRNSNIVTRKWFPQPSILAHPNCKLFITHGGLHGIMEGIQHAVPMVAIPFLGDQPYNTLFIEKAGIGIGLPPEQITEEKLLFAMNSVLNNYSYQEKMRERSTIFRDNPLDPLDNAIYWIEYVIRHKGAPHLRPAVLDLQWYQYLMLDVIAFYLLIFSLIVITLVQFIKLFHKCLHSLIFNYCFNCIKKSRKE